jgi:2-iminobutanoate/2-iminopropanoate deaminase
MIERYTGVDDVGVDYTVAAKVNGFIFTSGQCGVAPDGEPTAFGEQVRGALARVFAAVERLGGSRASLVKVNGYIADVKYFSEYHKVYRETFAGCPRPCRTTVQVGAFEGPILVEFDAVAAVETSDG